MRRFCPSSRMRARADAASRSASDLLRADDEDVERVDEERRDPEADLDRWERDADGIAVGMGATK